MEFSNSQIFYFFLRLSAYWMLGFFLIFSVVAREPNGLALSGAAMLVTWTLSVLWRDPWDPTDTLRSSEYCLHNVSDSGVADNPKFPITTAIHAFLVGALIMFMEDAQVVMGNLPTMFTLLTLLATDMINNIYNNCYAATGGVQSTSQSATAAVDKP
jgi:hypothetical protein